MPQEASQPAPAAGQPLEERDVIGAPGAEPYSPDELEAVRDIIETYNRPTSTQRRLLATIDALTAGGAR